MMLIFLFTDIEGSLDKWQRFKDAMGKALRRHDSIISELISKYGGKIVKHTGDGIFAVFEEAEKEKTLQCAIDIQTHVTRENWNPIGEMRIRIALHAGEAEERGEDYFGNAVSRTARLLSAGWGGQILLTPEVKKLCKLPQKAALIDLGMHILKDLAEPQQIFSLSHPDLILKEFPALRSLTAHPNNLPPQSTPFIGRRSELDEISNLIQNSTCRLLTLLGPGGIGKTRIALQAAAERVGDYSHGVYFVSLAPLSSPDYIIQTIANSLNINFYAKDDPQLQLLNYLREKHTLLVMDNFEHLTEGTDLLAAILREAPSVKLLTTSRQRLNLQGEWIFEVKGMRFPGAENIGDHETCSALELFEQSAHRVRPNFALDKERKALAIKICKLVGGLPLGIELAASWLRTLSLKEIVEEISKNYDFLESSSRDLPARHRSLKSVFDYSWKLLKTEEQQVLSKLSIFRGGFTKGAAKDVAGASLFLLSSLVDKSLLRKNAKERYEMQEVVRQYASKKLSEDFKEEKKTRDFHTAYYARFLDGRSKQLQGSDLKVALSEIVEEIDNIRTGWQDAVGQQKVELVEQYLGPVSAFYQNRGWSKEACQMFDQASQRLKKKGGDVLRAKIAGQQGSFAFRQGLYQEANMHYNENLNLARKAKDRREEATALNGLGNVAHSEGKYKKASEYLEESLRIRKEINDRGGIALSLNSLGIVARLKGDYERAKAFYTESLAISKDLDHPFRMGQVLINLGNVSSTTGNYDEAKEYYAKALEIFKGLGYKRGMALLSNNLGRVLHATGETEKAEKLFCQSLTIFKDISDNWGTGLALFNLGESALAKNELDKAWEYHTQALELNRKIGNRRREGEALLALGTVSLAQNKFEKAKDLCNKCFEIKKEIGDRRGVAGALFNLGEISYQLSEYRKAKELFEQAFVIYSDIGDKATKSNVLRKLGDIATSMKDFKQSLEYYSEALKIASQLKLQDTTLYTLFGITELLITEGKNENALILLGFLSGYGKAGGEDRKEAERLIRKIETKLPADKVKETLAEGRGRKLEEVIKKIDDKELA